MLRWIIFDLILIALFEFLTVIGTPKSSPNWEELISTNGIKFSPRNGPRSISLPLTHIKLYIITVNFFQLKLAAYLRERFG